MPEMTSPMICVSTHTRVNGFSPCTAFSSAVSVSSSARNAAGSMAGAVAAPSPAACAEQPLRTVADSNCGAGLRGFSPPARESSPTARCSVGQARFRHPPFRCAICPSRSLWSAPVAASRRQDPLLHRQIVDPPRGVFNRRRRGVLAQSDSRAQAVSKTLTALSGNCRPAR